jgi:hypothetical protein
VDVARRVLAFAHPRHNDHLPHAYHADSRQPSRIPHHRRTPQTLRQHARPRIPQPKNASSDHPHRGLDVIRFSQQLTPPPRAGSRSSTQWPAISKRRRRRAVSGIDESPRPGARLLLALHIWLSVRVLADRTGCVWGGLGRMQVRIYERRHRNCRPFQRLL